MRKVSIFIFAFSIFSGLAFSQAKKEEKKQDSVRWQYKPNFTVGIDVLNLGTGLFSDRQLIQGFVSSRINKKVHAVVDLGYDKNIYHKNGYDASVDGLFLKVGGFYMLSVDPENDLNGFYAGAKLAGSFYNQEYKSVPVKGANSQGVSLAFDPSTQSSYWVEANVGARVQVFSSRFFIDVNAQPRYLAYTTKQDEIKPMIVPGFGKSSGSFNMGFSWSIAYKF